MKTIAWSPPKVGSAVICAAGLGLAVSCLAAGSTNRFGFTGREIFPIDSQISQLHVADLDGDGLNDLIVVNNARSKINLLYNQTGKTNLAGKPRLAGKREPNELPPDARFRIDSIASEKRIFSMAVTDLNGDRRPDLAYYGDPRELIVLNSQGTNEWSAPKRWSIDDGQLSQNALATGDLDGTGRADLVLLAENCFYFLAQREDHVLEEPQKIPLSGTVKSIQVVDVDGDARSDSLLVNWDDRNPFRFRLQKQDRSLGPEIYFAMPSIRSYWADNLVADKQTQVITIAQNSGRAQVSEFTRKPAETLSGSFRQGQFQVWPLARTNKARRGSTWADVNGDGLPDLLVAEPEDGQVSLCLQQPDGSLAASKAFPTLAGISDLAVADWNGDGQPDIFMLSADERQVGVTRLDDKQRLPFPALIPLDGRPLALAAGALQAGAKPVLAVIVEPESKGDQGSQRLLVTRTADGKFRLQKLTRDFKSNPTTLAFHDADQDGHADLVILMPYENVKVLRQVPGKDFEELDVAPPGGAYELAQPWLSAADIDGDGKSELLLTQKNFLRAVVLQREALAPGSTNQAAWTFIVKEQINGAGSNSRLAGATAVPNGPNAIPSLFLLDVERKALTLCERDHAGVWQVVRNVPLPVSEFTSLQPLALGASKTTAITFLGLNAVACLRLDGEVWELNELDGYETPIKDGHLTDVVSGDLDNDGRKDLVFLETARNYLDLVLFDARSKLVPADRWQVFEERTFRSRRSDFAEPREAVVADVTGDNKNDLIILVHDRVIVYPQE
ncbi:MAG TPA: VCBS repeat-containing protein [Candidatus Paceibacterota bacterium]|nr:VCBS repeat-containing protein [Verrucomicrobiota bacterium]HSA09728.1 VCBS repeat-containing protein [Candidatus Paceibacterota bacterium]